MADILMAHSLAELEVAANELNIWRPGNEEQLKELVNMVCNKINFHLSNISSEKRDEALRKIHHVLVLNCESLLFEKLQMHRETGHLILVDKPLPPAVLVEVVWNFSLQQFTCDVIQYCSPYLGLLLLPELKKKIDSLDDIYLALQYIKEFTLSMYGRVVKDIVSGKVCRASEEIFCHFKKFLKYYDGENADKLKQLSAGELYKYSANVMQNIIDLLIKCTKAKDNVDKNLELFYSDSCIEVVKPDDATSNVSITELNNAIISLCKKNFSSITVNIWTIWAEINCEEELNKTMQTVIAEQMYVALLCLSNFEYEGDLSELQQILSCMATRPEDEDDKINKASLEDIIRCVSNDEKSQYKHKWFVALLNYSSLDDAYLSCLENALSLADSSDVKAIIDKVVCELKGEIDNEMSERLKNLALNAVRHLHLFDQFGVLEYYVNTHRDTSLCTANFRTTLVKILNKTSEQSYIHDQQDVSTFVCLSIESPKDVLFQVIEEGVGSLEQAVAMAGILKELCAVTKVYESYIIDKFQDILTNTEWDEKSFNKILHLVILLIKDHIINLDKFLIEVGLLLTNAGRDQNYKLLKMSLRILQKFIDEKVLQKVDICLFISVAQILEVTIWDDTSFFLDLSNVHEMTVQVAEGMANIMMETQNTLPDKSLKFLQTSLLKLSAFNMQYFSKLFLWMGLDMSNLVNFDTALVHLAHCNDRKCPCCKKCREFFNSEAKEREVIFQLCMILPRSCDSRWLKITRIVVSLFLSDELRFRIYYKVAVLILNSPQCQNQENVAFTMNFVNKITPILNHRVSKVTTTSYSSVKLYCDLVHILTSIPSDIRKDYQASFISMFSDIIKVSDCDNVKDFLVLTNMIQEKEVCQILCRQIHLLIGTERP